MGETFFEQVAREKRELFWKGRDCAKENSKKQRAELTNVTKACDTKVKLFIKNFKIVHKRILTKLKNTSQYSLHSKYKPLPDILTKQKPPNNLSFSCTITFLIPSISQVSFIKLNSHKCPLIKAIMKLQKMLNYLLTISCCFTSIRYTPPSLQNSKLFWGKVA